MSYIYSESNILKEPKNYMYSEFLGLSFLNDYCHSRVANIKSFIESEKSPSNPYMLVDHLASQFSSLLDINKIRTEIPLNKYDFSDVNLDANVINSIEIRQSVFICNEGNDINTEVLLESLIISLLNNEFHISEKNFLDKIVQRFEVSKKIYEFYGKDFKSRSGDNSKIIIYWYLSALLNLYYLKTKNIKYLNTILKLDDLLASLPVNDIYKHVSADGMILLFSFELTHIIKLALNKGLSLDY